MIISLWKASYSLICPTFLVFEQAGAVVLLIMDGDSSTGTPIFDLDILGVVMLEIQLELLMEAKEEELPF